MSEPEATQLITQESKRLGISEIVTSKYSTKLIDESDGHPYVIKILLGQVAKEGRAVTPERIIAGADQLLLALFERTYAALTPAGQRIFLLLSSWRSFIPSIAVEAVTLRPENERFNASAAIDELRRYSFIEEVVNEIEDQVFIGAPLAAASFGRRKLEASPFKVAVESDRKLLMEFGAGGRDSSRNGVMPRIDRLVSFAASRASENPDTLESIIPILEYLGSRIPKAFLRIATLLSEAQDEPDKKQIKNYIRRYLESTDNSEREKAWRWLAEICHSDNDPLGEVHALSEVAMLPTATLDTFSEVANRINNKLRELKERRVEKSWSNEVQQLVERVAEVMGRRLNDLDSKGCSRLAWLYLNIGNQERALDVARKGVSKNTMDSHCLGLIQRLER